MLFSKKYIIGHILVTLIALTCFLLSYWQFVRLDQRKVLNSKITAAMDHKSVDLNSIASPSISNKELQKIEYRSVQLNGRFSSKGEVFISGRALDGDPGYYVATPFYITSSDSTLRKKSVIYINRGWIPQNLGDAVLEGRSLQYIRPSAGYRAQRTLIGLVRLDESKRLFGNDNQITKEDPTSIRLSSKIFYDISGTKQLELFPFWIQMKQDNVNQVKAVIKQSGAVQYPVVLPEPKLSEGSHFSYALQWLFFGLIAIVTWGVICFQANSRKR